MLVLPLAFYAIFCYKPMYGVIIAFQKYNMRKGIAGSKFIGLENFKFMLNLRDFPIALRNTLWLNFLQLIIGFPVPVILAIMLNEIRSVGAKKISQTLLYLPHFLSWVIIGGMVLQIFAPTGVINTTLRKLGSRLQGHPSMKMLPGIEMSTGSLGQGISTACGMALSGKISNDTYKVYAILGDGEIEEGQVWEAAMFAAHYQLDNLVAVVDNNGLQIDGRIDEVMSPYPIDEKFRAFGWHVINVDDAHDFDKLEKAFNEAETVLNKPTVIIQKSTKGKGVSYMENQVGWHGKAPNDEEYEVAMKELSAHLAELEK